MVYNDKGIEELQKLGIRDVVGTIPNYLTFAGSDNTFTGSETSMVNEFLRKQVTWAATGINSKFTVQLASTEAVGSNIQATGLFSEMAIGSGNLHNINASFIGTKTNTFNVELEGEIIIRRPTV